MERRYAPARLAVLEVISTVINDFCDAPDVEFEADFPIEEDDDGY